MHTLASPFSIKNLQASGCFTGYASVFYLSDAVDDIVCPGAFKQTLQQWQQRKSLPKLLWQHNPAEPIGVWHSIQEDHKGLYVTGQLLLEVQRAREAYSLLKAGALDGLSIGFTPVTINYQEKTNYRLLQEVDLHEISLVTFPCNGGARVTALKQQQDDPPLLQSIQRLADIIRAPKA